MHEVSRLLTREDSWDSTRLCWCARTAAETFGSKPHSLPRLCESSGLDWTLLDSVGLYAPLGHIHTASRAEPNRTELIRLGKQTYVVKWKHSHCTPNRAEPNRTEPDRACSLADVCFYSPADDRFSCAIGLTSWN